jgi:hypothetical protein
MRTHVYVDGFNLYYGALRGTAFKWLDIAEMCRLLLPAHDIRRIVYCTARVNGRPTDPEQPQRQQAYLRALRTIPNLDIVYGHHALQRETVAGASWQVFDGGQSELGELLRVNRLRRRRPWGRERILATR